MNKKHLEVHLGISYSSFFTSIDSLSDWHIRQIRQLVPSWTHFTAFLANFPSLRETLSTDDIDKLLSAIYPEIDEAYDVDGLDHEDVDAQHKAVLIEAGYSKTTLIKMGIF